MELSDTAHLKSFSFTVINNENIFYTSRTRLMNSFQYISIFSFYLMIHLILKIMCLLASNLLHSIYLNYVEGTYTVQIKSQ